MTELAVGDILEGRYRIDHPIARGGMSTVYRCVDLRLGRAVAAKIMHDEFADDPASRIRFRREARAMAQLSHPNLVGVYDFSSDEGISFLIMELITGGTLRELLAERGPMPPHAATAVMRAMLTGLSVAHAKGMVHRDIKPDNILINSDHRVKVADFGLVRAGASSHHATSEIIGTAAYLSPEQVDGSDITPATDVYSAGIVLFELLTGEVPFRGDTPLAHAYQRLQKDVPKPSSLIDGVPQLFDELVATATSRDPEERFADAGEFLAALDDVAAELNLPAFTVPVPTNSAAHRAAEVPTDTTGIIETTHLGQVNAPAEPTPPANETKVLDADGGPAVPAAPVPPVAPTVAAVPAVPQAAELDEPEEFDEPDDPDDLDGPPPVTNRSGWKLALGIILALAIMAGVLTGAWWFGSGRYGEIPQVVGLNRTEAIATVEEAGFTPATSLVYDNEVPADDVVGTDPAGGEKLLPGDEVTVLVSQGKPTVPEVPDGMGVEDYEALAGERTLKVATGDSVYSADAPVGSIASTDPKASTPVPIGATVTVHISKGPEPIEVPNLSGSDVDTARTQLEDLGLNVGEVTEEFDPNVAEDAVISSDPGPGTSLKRGEKVNLTISTAVAIPDVTGMDRDEAKQTLKDAGFTVKESREDSLAGTSEDSVVTVSPEPGTLVDPAENTKVTITLPGKITVPDVTGMTVKDARTKLSDIGLKISASSRDNAKTITSQSPAAGTELKRGGRVSVNAS